jgi:hypothetical protein
MKCFLHIGTSKTGTTTLQHFLDFNRDILKRKGYTFTLSAGKSNNVGFALACIDAGEKLNSNQYQYAINLLILMGVARPSLTDPSIQNSQDLENYRISIIKKLKKELANNRHSNIIISSENFQDLLTTKAEINRLRDLLYELGCTEIKVVVYLREPVALANSFYSTVVLVDLPLLGVVAAPPFPGSDNERYFDNLCNHRNTLEQWGSIFGNENIIPRIFDRNDLKDGSIIHDFLECIGIPWSDEFTLIDNENESISHTGLEIIRRINIKFPPLSGNRPNPSRRRLVYRVYHIVRYFGKGKYFMPTELFHAYTEAYSKSNEWTRQNWFPERDVLFKQRAIPAATSSEIPEEQLNLIADLIADIWNYFNDQRLFVLKNKVKRALKPFNKFL